MLMDSVPRKQDMALVHHLNRDEATLLAVHFSIGCVCHRGYLVVLPAQLLFACPQADCHQPHSPNCAVIAQPGTRQQQHCPYASPQPGNSYWGN
jgi:hypothetical protein